MDILKVLNWRYATKRMNGKKVPEAKIETILESIRLSASSIGLQPYTIYVIEDKNLLTQILPIANNQPQMVECSHLLVFAAWNNLTKERIDAWLKDVQDARGNVAERTQNFAMYLKSKAKNDPESENFTWIAKQSYIALGTALIAAAAEEVDATPMEGFNAAQLDELLKLGEKGLKSVLIVPLGYRDEATDFLLNQKKVRRSSDTFIVRL
jgi:nitroreductase / dihydropteridine reductase